MASLRLVAHDAQEEYAFGPWPISASEVFARTQLSFAFVNLKPLVPGHTLVSPLRPAARFAELSPGEVADAMLLAQAVATTLEPHYGAAAATLAIQDGAAAGQTVPHVHVHVLPRRAGDFERNDEVYTALEAQEEAMAGDLQRHTGDAATAPSATSGSGEGARGRGAAARGSGAAARGGGGGAPGSSPGAEAAGGGAGGAPRAQRLDLDVERRPRTREEMAEEAAVLRALFPVV